MNQRHFARSIVRAVMALTAVLIFIETSSAQPVEGTPELRNSLNRFLRTFDNDYATHYVAAFTDLNGDQKREAIVYLVGNEWCGSGGCTTLVLREFEMSWIVVTKITIVQLPIRVLDSKSNGWRDLVVSVQGGGMKGGYVAGPRSNGKSSRQSFEGGSSHYESERSGNNNVHGTGHPDHAKRKAGSVKRRRSTAASPERL